MKYLLIISHYYTGIDINNSKHINITQRSGTYIDDYLDAIDDSLRNTTALVNNAVLQLATTSNWQTEERF